MIIFTDRANIVVEYSVKRRSGEIVRGIEDINPSVNGSSDFRGKTKLGTENCVCYLDLDMIV